MDLFNQFVIAFREGIEACLVAMTVIVALKRGGQKRLLKVTYAAIVSSVVLCAVTGYIIRHYSLMQDAVVEVILYGVACVLVTTMVFWMMKTGKNLRKGIGDTIGNLEKRSGMWAAIGIFSFVFFMIAREGVEMTFLLLAFGAATGGSSYIGAMLSGLLAAAGLSYLLSKGLVKINLGGFLYSTSFVLILFAIQLVFDVVHEASELGWITIFEGTGAMYYIDYLHHEFQLFSYAGLALFTVLVAYYITKATISSRSGQTPGLTPNSGRAAA